MSYLHGTLDGKQFSCLNLSLKQCGRGGVVTMYMHGSPAVWVTMYMHVSPIGDQHIHAVHALVWAQNGNLHTSRTISQLQSPPQSHNALRGHFDNLCNWLNVTFSERNSGSA
mmetsp:Transcript_12226/g.29151  ORF Transcript_12226/g.29151 Transcript_12226/m.29151 type:complete len:112 (-) Transcript_12226:481-816(-)